MVGRKARAVCVTPLLFARRASKVHERSSGLGIDNPMPRRSRAPSWKSQAAQWRRLHCRRMMNAAQALLQKAFRSATD